jgi:hypothetical protein
VDGDPTVRGRAALLPLLALVPALGAGCGRLDGARGEPIVLGEPIDAERTAAYTAALDVDAIARRGAEFVDGPPDPDRLTRVRERLRGVDRRAVLEHLFRAVTAGADDDTARHLAVLRFLQRATRPADESRPRHDDGTECSDPLVLLEMNGVHGRQTARLAVDLFEAGGYEARCVAFDDHTAAEVRYGGGWHHFDADSSAGPAGAVRGPDGVIPSWAELSRDPAPLDRLPHRYELRPNGAPRRSGTVTRSASRFFVTNDRARKYYRKPRPAHPGEHDYGWGRTVEFPADWVEHDGAPPHQPGVAVFRRVAVERAGARSRVTIGWRPAIDADDDVLGYRVFLSSAPRGWSYARFPGHGDARAHWSDPGGWRPEMYDALFRPPPDDLGVIEVTAPEVTFEIDAGTTCYVTVMAFDAYHERIGKTQYLMSNELRIPKPGTVTCFRRENW